MVKNMSVNAGDVRDAGSTPGSGRSPGGWHGNPFQYSCLENTIDRGTWWATVQGIAELEVIEHKCTHDMDTVHCFITSLHLIFLYNFHKYNLYWLT